MKRENFDRVYQIVTCLEREERLLDTLQRDDVSLRLCTVRDNFQTVPSDDIHPFNDAAKTFVNECITITKRRIAGLLAELDTL